MTYRTYGTTVAGKQPSEGAEMATFFNALPTRYKAIALHIRNEGRRSARQMAAQKAQGGFVKGASDIIIPGRPTFVCELKSRNKGASPTQEQVDYLEAAASVGAFACLAYGYEAALEAFGEWLDQ